MKRRRSKKKKLLIAAGAAVSVLAVLCLAAFIGLKFFRPQLASLYREVMAYLSAEKDPEFGKYKDNDGKIVIWLDPGHGGSDPGAVSEFLGDETESSINYRLSRLVKDELEKYGYTVKFSWDENTPLSEDGQYPYQERSERANLDPEIDLYISLHCNSFTDPSVKGARLYYCSEGPGYNYYLAKEISEGIEKAHGGEKPALYPMPYENAFWVIKYTKAPSVLLETLFVSNEEDAKKLLDEEWLAREAYGIALGLHEFIDG